LQFVHGRLDIGQVMAPPLIRAVKKHINPTRVTIIDAPPGTSCPVIEAVKQSDFCILVTEPTPFGLNDLKLAAELSLNMGNITGIVINRSDGDDVIIADFAKEYDIPILGRIPFDRKYAETYSYGGILIKHHPELTEIFADIFMNIKKLEGRKPSRKIIPNTRTQSFSEADFKNRRITGL